jgi:cytochrome c
MRCAFAIAALLLMLAASGCQAGQAVRPYIVETGGNASHGRQLIRAYGCGACHSVPGVYGAHGRVGPPLIGLGERTIVAGQLPNSADNLVRWIQHPRTIEPKTAMPDLGVSDQDARDIAAYLYTLSGPEGTSWNE